MVFKLKPILLSKIWGGKKLKKTYCTELDNIGEVWGISAHVENSNQVIDTNMSLRDLFSNQKHLFGNYPSDEFPILVKFIDAQEDLSIQVHPNDDYAKSMNSLGKEECWYILSADSQSEILIGHNAQNKQQFQTSIEKNQFEKLFRKYLIKKGDYFYIPAGTVHAILKNTLILEVSQSSNITFRIHDYNRKDNNGKRRKLHIQEALEVVNVPDNKLVKNHIKKYFDFDIIHNEKTIKYKSDQYGDYLILIDGEGFIDNLKFNFGDFFMVSSNSSYELKGNFKFAKITLI